MDNTENVLNIDCADIAMMDPVLYSHLITYPTEVIPLMDQEAQALASSYEASESGGAEDLQACPPSPPLSLLPKQRGFQASRANRLQLGCWTLVCSSQHKSAPWPVNWAYSRFE